MSSRNGIIRALLRSKGGVPKKPIEQSTVLITEEGLEGDWQDDRKHHGGPERALCLFSVDVIAALKAEGHPIDLGFAGENIDIEGIDWTLLKESVQLELGNRVVIEITRDAVPCQTIKHCFLEEKFTRISEKTNPGFSRMYAKVLRAGHVSVGDSVRVREPG